MAEKLPDMGVSTAYLIVVPPSTGVGGPAGGLFGGLLGTAISFLGGGGRIEFQLIPQSITDTKGAKYSEVDILGRSEPIKAYASSAPRTISFDIDYYWYSDNMSSIGAWPKIKTQIDKLQALAYPEYKKRFSMPPKVLFYFGDMYKGLPCIVTSVQISYNPDGGDQWVRAGGDGVFQDPNFHPSHIRASVSMDVVHDMNNVPGFDDRKGNLFANLTNQGISFITSKIRGR